MYLFKVFASSCVCVLLSLYICMSLYGYIHGCTCKCELVEADVDAGGLCLLLPPGWPEMQKSACLCLEPALCQSLGSWSSLMTSLAVSEHLASQMPPAAPHPAFLGVLVSPCRSSGFCDRHFHKLSLLPGPRFLFLLNPQPLLLMCFLFSQPECEPALWGLVLQTFVSRAENASFTKTFVNES